MLPIAEFGWDQAAVLGVLYAIGRGGEWVVTSFWSARREGREVTRAERRDAIEELYRLMEVKDQDHEEDRRIVHGLRNELATLTPRLAVAETRLDDCEKDRQELHLMIEVQQRTIESYRAALEEAGIRLPAPTAGRNTKPTDPGGGA